MAGIAHTDWEPVDILRHYWGYDAFRPLQEDIINSILDGHDTLALLPTGGGKSICYQVPALQREGVCIVVSPLIALMKDQVYQLHRRHILARAVFSGMSPREIDITLDNCVYGSVKLLYVSPERLKTELFRERLRRMQVNLLAVDEAHCVSQWGYDFRPPYLDIAEVREWLPDVPVLALTASATRVVQDDIMDKLHFGKNKRHFRQSFARDNLHYLCYKEDNKPGKLVEMFTKVPGTALVYVRNRRKTKDVAEWLTKAGISASYYHAGLSTDERNKRQEQWLKGNIPVMVCTNAFGMGIDKPDVRVVAHIDLPDSPEAYYQEAGRAGRDGKKAYVAILYDDRNLRDLRDSVARGFPPMDQIRKVYHALGDFFGLAVGSGAGHSFDFNIGEFCKTYHLSIQQTFQCLKVLEQNGVLMATEAVYLAPRVKVSATREQLYKLEVQNLALAPLIQLILRSYEGAFDHYVRINEEFLAGRLNTKVPKIREDLKQLQQVGLIFYEPFKDKPQIVFLQGRHQHNSDLGMDFGKVNTRRTTVQRQVDAMLAYAQNRVRCRQQELLTYFNETDTVPCGRCDVCRGKYTKGISAATFETVQEKIHTLLTAGPTPIKTLPSRVSRATADEVMTVARWMLDHALLVQDDTGLVYLKEVVGKE